MQGPWCIVGNFNAILYKEDRIGGDEVTAHELSELNNVLDHCELQQMRSVGPYHSWTNSTVSSRIDRALIIGSWHGTFDFSQDTYMSHGLSDHTPILL